MPIEKIVLRQYLEDIELEQYAEEHRKELEEFKEAIPQHLTPIEQVIYLFRLQVAYDLNVAKKIGDKPGIIKMLTERATELEQVQEKRKMQEGIETIRTDSSSEKEIDQSDDTTERIGGIHS